MNKMQLLTAVTVTVLGAGLYGISSVSAQTTSNPQTSIIQKISEQFGLNQSEVQKVFDEVHEEKHEQMEARMQERLNQLVTEGKITAEQRQLLIEKHEELEESKRSEIQEMQNLTWEERKEKMSERKTELEAWAEENGIDTQYLFFGHGMRGMGMKEGMGMRFDRAL